MSSGLDFLTKLSGATGSYGKSRLVRSSQTHTANVVANSHEDKAKSCFVCLIVIYVDDPNPFLLTRSHNQIIFDIYLAFTH